jgi:hypothetical protein
MVRYTELSPVQFKGLWKRRPARFEIEKQPQAMDVYFISLVSALMVRRSDANSRPRAIASAVYRPCLNAFLLPFGAPGDFPPCIRQRPFGIAADRHWLPLRVRAPHRGLRCMGNLFGIGSF